MDVLAEARAARKALRGVGGRLLALRDAPRLLDPDQFPTVAGFPYVEVLEPYVGGTTWNFIEWADIPDARDESRAYLRRLRIVQTPWSSWYLHWIVLPDEDRDPHDHPFPFYSLILRGGYTERLWRIVPGFTRDQMGSHERRWLRGSLHKMDQEHAHMITDLRRGTLTMIFAGAKNNGGRWGFYTPNFVPWQAYNKAKYGAADEYALDEFA
jgi:hypothetical protein